ncbi:thermonuclease family protein [bacterium]|nr:thermonuclease family protein [bacterium]
MALIIAALLWGSAAYADTLEGIAVSVRSGDTLEVRSETSKKVRIFRILGIEAPRRGQKGFANSRRSLESLVKGQKVTVDWLHKQVCPPSGGKCGYLGKVLLKGDDIGLRLIRVGAAWQDQGQKREQSTTDKVLYQDAERQAVKAKAGVWKLKAKNGPKQSRN